MTQKKAGSTADMWYTLNNLADTLKLELEKKVEKLEKQLPRDPTELPVEITTAVRLRAAQKFKKLKSIAKFTANLEVAGIAYDVDTWWDYQNGDTDFTIRGAKAIVGCNLDVRLAKGLSASLDGTTRIPMPLLPTERKDYAARMALHCELSEQIERLNSRIRNLDNAGGRGRELKTLLKELAAETDSPLPKKVKDLITELATQLATFVESQIGKKKA